MRRTLLAVLLLLVAGPAVEAQTCREGPVPPVPSLFPNEVDGMPRELYNVANGCHTYLYRQAKTRAGDGVPWAAVMLEEHTDPFLGDDAARLATHYERAGLEVHRVDGWPVAYRGTSELGAEFVTVKDRLRVTVLVKEGIDLESSRVLADGILAGILDRILMPCG